MGFVEAPLVAISGATLGLVAAGGFLHSASWIPPWLLYGSLVIPRISSIGVGWLLRVCFLPPAFFCFVLACKPCRDPGLTCKKESGSTQLGVPTRGGDFTTNLATALCHCLLPVAHPRPRCSTETSCRRTYGSATAPSLLFPNNCKQKSGSTQLEVPLRGAISQET